MFQSTVVTQRTMISKEQAEREKADAVAKALANAEREKQEAVAKAVATTRYEMMLAYRKRKTPCRDYSQLPYVWREQ